MDSGSFESADHLAVCTQTICLQEVPIHQTVSEIRLGAAALWRVEVLQNLHVCLTPTLTQHQEAKGAWMEIIQVPNMTIINYSHLTDAQ